MRRSLMLRRGLACARSRLLMRRRLAYARSRLLMRRRLAYVRRRLLMRRWTRSVVIVRLSARCAGAMRSRPTLVHVSRGMRNIVVRTRRITRTVRSRRIRIRRGRTRWRPRNIVVNRPRRLCVARIVGPWSVYRRIVRHWSITRPDHTCTAEGRRFRSCRHFGPAVIY